MQSISSVQAQQPIATTSAPTPSSWKKTALLFAGALACIGSGYVFGKILYNWNRVEVTLSEDLTKCKEEMDSVLESLKTNCGVDKIPEIILAFVQKEGTALCGSRFSYKC